MLLVADAAAIPDTTGFRSPAPSAVYLYASTAPDIIFPSTSHPLVLGLTLLPRKAGITNLFLRVAVLYLPRFKSTEAGPGAIQT